MPWRGLIFLKRLLVGYHCLASGRQLYAVDHGSEYQADQQFSVASDGTQGNESSYHMPKSISADGRYVSFSSGANNFVSGDTNNVSDVFIHDNQNGETSRISVASDGSQGNNDSLAGTISADGRYVAFRSTASNLVTNDTNSTQDVFVHDRQTGQTSRVSVASDGTQGNGNSSQTTISADGSYVTFESIASNLVGGDTNGYGDIFVHDRQTGETSIVSVASDGTQGNGDSWMPIISADGRYVAFASSASNLVSGDTNGYGDIFVHDRQTGETSIVSVTSDGTQGNGDSWHPIISADGRYVSFQSEANNLVIGDTNYYVDIFVHDRQTGETNRISVASDGTQGDGPSLWPTISADGVYVAYESNASNIVSGDTNGSVDIFLHNRQTGETSIVSVASDGTQGNYDSYRSAISDEGSHIAFYSRASNLVNGDTNGYIDVFVHDRGE